MSRKCPLLLPAKAAKEATKSGGDGIEKYGDRTYVPVLFIFYHLPAVACHARIIVPGFQHQVTKRGNRREPILFEDGDQEV
jgi:hypothetical protein